MNSFPAISTLLVLACAASAHAQLLEIDPGRKYCWSENIGYLNWRDAGLPPAPRGVRIHRSFLSGMIWSGNIGWINLGDGSPANGDAYANTTGADFGVNLDDATGALSGLAWGENIGWINFTLRSIPPDRQPAYDAAARRLRGFAWGENIGWINLNDNRHYLGVVPACRADFNMDAAVNSQDFFDFLAAFFAGAPEADFNQDRDINSQDFFDFLTAFFAGC